MYVLLYMCNNYMDSVKIFFTFKKVTEVVSFTFLFRVSHCLSGRFTCFTQILQSVEDEF